MDGKDFAGTITPTEARITIFEDVLGFTQADLAGITLGYIQSYVSSKDMLAH